MVATNMKVNRVKCCHYAINITLFFSLVIFCYVFYMKEAIEEFQTGATTVVKHQEIYRYEPPALTICPNPRVVKSWPMLENFPS